METEVPISDKKRYNSDCNSDCNCCVQGDTKKPSTQGRGGVKPVTQEQALVAAMLIRLLVSKDKG